MKPFSRLFGRTPPAPPQPTVEQRIAALQTAAVEDLAATALQSDDPSVRVAAIQRLPDCAALRTLAGVAEQSQGTSDSVPLVVRQAAHERLAQLLETGSLVDDQALLTKLVLEGASSRLRQVAAARINDPAQLRDLLSRVRGKDKSVYKLIKQKCDALVAEQRDAAECAREAEAVCASLERHGSRSHDALYAAALEVLTARWRALPAHADPSVAARGKQALERCNEVLAAKQRELAQQAAERVAQQEARGARARALQDEQQKAAAQAEADAQASAAAVAAREAEDRARTEQLAEEAQAHRQIGGLIRLCADALRFGNTRKAARFRLAIDEALQTAPAVPPYVTRNLQQLDESLNELRQWKDYVVAPKRIELIEEMEALVGSQEEPAALAEHIRALQQEWRTINKGIASDASADVARFQQAFQAAFKPCEEYFAAQAAMRRENLVARKRVLERLQAFTATQEGEHADQRLIVQVLREAPQEWRSHAPVDRDANRPVEVEFQQAMDRLRAILNAWYERNAAEKRALITQVRHLSSIEDTSQGIDGVKRLQAAWKETGPVSREQSQALWDEFHGACDAVFKRREQVYAEFSAGLREAKEKAVALCEQIEQAVSESTADRAGATAKIQEWHGVFDAIGELPRAEARGLQDRFERAIARYEGGLAQQATRAAEAAESNLLQAGRYVRAYERAVMRDVPETERAALRTVADEFIAGVQRWPKGGLQALKQALVRAETASAANVEAHESALRMLCIRAEIHSAVPTPPEDEALRRDYQLRLLMENMGQANRADDRDWDALLLEWIAVGAVTQETDASLETRFMRCLARRPAKSTEPSRFAGHKGGGDARRDERRERPNRNGPAYPR